MAEPATTAAVGLAVATVAVGTVGSIFGVPADAIILSVIGAALAMSQGPKLELSAESFKKSVYVFVLSLTCGIVFGQLAALGLAAVIEKQFTITLPAGLMRMAWCFICALGAQQIFAAILSRGVKTIDPPRNDQT